MKYLFINVVAGSGSTGRIAAEQCRALQAQGHECVLAYGRWESLALTFGTSRKTEGFWEASMAFLASLAIPVADAYCSRHPLFPQLHGTSSLGFTGACPISPPAPWAPVTIFSLMMIPPPTPVPRVTMIRFLAPCPPPFHISPRAATLASFPAFTLRPVRSPRSFSIFFLPQ